MFAQHASAFVGAGARIDPVPTGGQDRLWTLVGYEPEIGVRCSEGRSRPLVFESLAQASGGQNLPLADLTGRFVQSDRNAVYKQGLS